MPSKIPRLPKLERQDTPQGRFYLTPDGNRYPSITTVLSQTSDKDLSAWRQRIGEAEAAKQLHMAQYRGTALHDLVERYLNKEIIEYRQVNPIVLSYFLPVKRYIDANVTDVLLTETPLYSDKLQIAGTVDAVAKVHGEMSVIDLKTAFRSFNENYIQDYYLQATAYICMFLERTGITIDRFYIIGGVENAYNAETFTGKAVNYFHQLIKRRKKFDDITETI